MKPLWPLESLSAAGTGFASLFNTGFLIPASRQLSQYSGGPLLDSAGRLIGVNTAIVSGSSAFAGVGFAVPVDVVNRGVSEIILEGSVARPGIGIVALTEAMTARLDVDGVVIAAVQPGSPAARAGLEGIDQRAGRLGDVITHAEGKQVQSVVDLAAILDEVGIGNEATLKVRRGRSTRRVQVTVVNISAPA
ncbi:MAG: PDZ domain-containing protein [Lamprobacter sp.]|uniref:S1C family serine protease n=1 Tax=Lamprobacter sp. TaxID=3100796 RepID=UPI002B25C57B|nr:PDZ domain-containing protein [Lamprobacter sp.]MEA3643053.1 PDZ domain-containing protein [Lamprobacter sp.]